MPELPRRAILVSFAVAAVVAALVAATRVRPEPYQVVVFGGMVVAAIVSAVLDAQHTFAEDRPTAPSFIIDFATLLFWGPYAMTYVSTVSATTRVLMRPHLSPQQLLYVPVAVLSTQAAGQVHALFGGSFHTLLWPQQGVPIGMAVIVYGLARSVLVNVVVPLSRRQSLDPAWLKSAIHDSSSSFIGAGIVVGLVEAINRQAWEVLTMAMVPMYHAYRAYSRQLRRLDDRDRQREVIESIDQGICGVDDAGRIRLWNEAMVRLLDCRPEQAIGRSLTAAVPALSQSAVPAAIGATLKDRTARTLDVNVKGPDGLRTLQVRLLPGVEEMTLLWQDVTEQLRSKQTLSRRHERLALAAEAANDGLWEWNVDSEEFHYSSRWAEMIGIPRSEAAGRPELWLDRVHPEDIAALQDALYAHQSGRTARLQLEQRLRCEDGAYRWFFCRGVAERGADQKPIRIAGSLTDISDWTLAQERLRQAGSRDPLTGLWNRVVFVEALGRRLTDFKEWRGGQFAVLYLDLDRFKLVNDSLGHLVGDELLTAASRRLESCLRDGDALARLGGDEFAILLNGLTDFAQANGIASRIQSSLSAPFSIGGREVFTSASIGIAFSRADYASPDDMMRDADTAMYHAKSAGRARHELFDANMHAEVVDRLSLEGDLRHAVNNRVFEAYYQPIVSLSTRLCVGFEALIRWKRNGEYVSPAKFIPVAEELGLIEPIGTWMLQEACRAFADWQRRFPTAGLECITVNVSTRQLMQQNFLQLVQQAVRSANLEPRDLRLEITETALVENPRHAAGLLKGLRNFGVKIYLDDFGTGYSSLSHLAKLPVDALKIDRSFVRNLLENGRPAIVESILALARTLNTGVVAEGIENDQQARELERLGCRHAQGYFFSPPIPAASVEVLLESQQRLGEVGSGQPDHELGAWRGDIIVRDGLKLA